MVAKQINPDLRMEKSGLLLNAFEYKRVGSVDDGGVEAGEIDLGGCFTIVAHTFADDTQGNALGFGRGGPAMAGYVEG